MARTTATEFQRRFDTFRRHARREPVEIMCDGRRALMLVSAEHYDWLLAAARRRHRTDETQSVVRQAVRRAEMAPEHKHLDDLLK